MSHIAGRPASVCDRVLYVLLPLSLKKLIAFVREYQHSITACFGTLDLGMGGNKPSLLAERFGSGVVGGTAWQCPRCKCSTPNCQIAPLCWKMNFPSLAGAAPFTDSAWLPLSCVCSLYGICSKHRRKINGI